MIHSLFSKVMFSIKVLVSKFKKYIGMEKMNHEFYMETEVIDGKQVLKVICKTEGLEEDNPKVAFAISRQGDKWLSVKRSFYKSEVYAMDLYEDFFDAFIDSKEEAVSLGFYYTITNLNIEKES